MKTILTIATTLSLLATPAAFAQEDAAAPGAPSAGDNEELNVIEIELDKSKPAPTPVETRESAPAAANPAAPPPPDSKPIDFQGLGRLAPFTEVSVIQKRYLPKTGRFQFFIGPTLITNDPFFNTVGGVVKFGYFFSESFGLEASYFALSTSEAKATKELKDIQNIRADSLVSTKSSSALDLLWVPIYGKMTWFNERIVPFDFYFSLGGGSSKLDSESAGTAHVGAGQIFALSKARAIRWDFSWNFFSATGLDQKKSSYNNLFLTVGYSWFFPEAKYR